MRVLFKTPGALLFRRLWFVKAVELVGDVWHVTRARGYARIPATGTTVIVKGQPAA